MKLSNLLLIFLSGITLISLVFYNLNLKTSFLHDDYKNEFYGMSFSPLSPVEVLHVKGAEQIRLKIIQGNEEGVWVKKQDKEQLVWDQQGNVLTIDLSSAARAEKVGSTPNQINLVLKNVAEVSTDGYLETEQEKKYSSFGSVELRGFTLATLKLSIKQTNVLMDNLTVDTLQMTMGERGKGIETVTLAASNAIKVATFEIPSYGELILEDLNIENVNFRVSKDAQVSLKGKLLKKLSD